MKRFVVAAVTVAAFCGAPALAAKALLPPAVPLIAGPVLCRRQRRL